jgi:hypothetical protein
MINISDFIKQDNLEKMTNEELMKLWGFLISDHDVIYLVDRIKNIINKRSV